MFCLLTNNRDIYLYKNGFVSLYESDENSLIKNNMDILEMNELKEYINKCYPSNYIILYFYIVLYNIFSEKIIMNRIKDIILDSMNSILVKMNENSKLRDCFELLQFEFCVLFTQYIYIINR